MGTHVRCVLCPGYSWSTSTYIVGVATLLGTAVLYQRELDQSSSFFSPAGQTEAANDTRGRKNVSFHSNVTIYEEFAREGEEAATAAAKAGAAGAAGDTTIYKLVQKDGGGGGSNVTLIQMMAEGSTNGRAIGELSRAGFELDTHKVKKKKVF